MSTQSVKLNTPYVGNYLNKEGQFAGHFSHQKGDTVELPESVAKRFVAKGYASAVNTK
jgi:hypothetical protein